MEDKRKKQVKGKKDNVYVVDIRKLPKGKIGPIDIPMFTFDWPKLKCDNITSNAKTIVFCCKFFIIDKNRHNFYYKRMYDS